MKNNKRERIMADGQDENIEDYARKQEMLRRVFWLVWAFSWLMLILMIVHFNKS